MVKTARDLLSRLGEITQIATRPNPSRAALATELRKLARDLSAGEEDDWRDHLNTLSREIERAMSDASIDHIDVGGQDGDKMAIFGTVGPSTDELKKNLTKIVEKYATSKDLPDPTVQVVATKNGISFSVRFGL